MIPVRVVFDQINIIASYFRKWNYFYMTNP